MDVTRTEASPRGGQGRRAIPVWIGVAAFVVSVTVYVLMTAHMFGSWYHSDASVYRAAGRLVWDRPGSLYHERLASPRLPFTYPPFAALLFALPSPLPFGFWQFTLAGINLLVLPVIGYACLGMAGRYDRRMRVAGAFAVAAVAPWLEPTYMTMFFGQVNLVLLALITADFALPGRSRWKGVGIGVAAGIKLTPLIFIAYLWFARGRPAAVRAAGTFLATVAVGFAILPKASLDFWGGQFGRPGDGPERLVNQSLNGVVQRLTDGGTTAATLWWIVVVIPVLAAGLAAAVAAGRRGMPLLALLTCGVTSLLASPISWSHHWVYAIPALALAVFGPGGTSAVPPRPVARAAGAATVIGLFTMWPVRLEPGGGVDLTQDLVPLGWLRNVAHDGGREFGWQGIQLIGGNYYVLVALAFLAATIAYLLRGQGNPISLWTRGQRQPSDLRGRKNARSSVATCSGSSCAMKCPPRCGVLQ